MRLKRVLAATLLALGFAPFAFAQSPTPLSVASLRHYNEGVNHVFEIDVANDGDRDVTTRGRLVVINVYAATLPTTIPIADLNVPAGGVARAVVRWSDAPIVGEIRALLVLNDGQHVSLVESYSFWIFPFFEVAVFLGIAALAAGVAIAAMRVPKYLKGRVPQNMLAYVVEFDDTVVTLSTRFEVTWQDIVRANRLKPPYALKEGSRILIPRHGLRRSEPTDKA